MATCSGPRPAAKAFDEQPVQQLHRTLSNQTSQGVSNSAQTPRSRSRYHGRIQANQNFGAAG